MDHATTRYRTAMIEPRTGGRCKHCPHSVDEQHTQLSSPPFVWCAGCEAAGTRCDVGALFDFRRDERAIARVTR